MLGFAMVSKLIELTRFSISCKYLVMSEFSASVDGNDIALAVNRALKRDVQE